MTKIVPLRPLSAREIAKEPGILRGVGKIERTPFEFIHHGVIKLDAITAIKVPRSVVDEAHHREAFRVGAMADISYHADPEEGLVAVRINQVCKARRTA